MNKKTTISIVIVVIIVVAIGAFFYLTRAPSAPSEDIETAVDQSLGSTTAPAGAITYNIDPSQSVVSFQIGEVLHGSPYQPVGTTSQVAGTVSVANGQVAFGTIAVNARTFVTDSKQRDGAIARLILKSEDDANEFIYFKPTSTDIAPASMAGMYGGTVTGDLTISGVTKPETFNVSFMTNGGTIVGTASTTLKRSDFNLQIPNIPFVADVTDQFTVTANITAVQGQ